MNLSINKIKSLSVVLLLYYVYLNSIKKVMIPVNNIVIPCILFLVVIVSIISSRGKIQFKKGIDGILCLSWIFILIYILINNNSITNNFVNGGLIQLCTMIVFLCFVSTKDNWGESWVKVTEVFIIVHAIATIVFFYNSSLYIKFANYFFTGDTLIDCIKNYKRGYMSGLCGHFSSNGMILGMGLILFVEEAISIKNDNKEKKIINLFASIIVVYALILSSKRSPLIAAMLSIIIVYIIASKKNVVRNIFILVISCTIIFGVYKFLLPQIPGLSTIADKFEALDESDAGVLNGRNQLWQIAIELMHKNPIFGSGYGSYQIYAKEKNAITTSAHNYYLQVMAELGIIGLLMYIISFICGIIMGIKLLNDSSNKDQTSNFNKKIALEIQFFVLIYSITSSALLYYYILIPYFLAVASERSGWLKKQIGGNK